MHSVCEKKINRTISKWPENGTQGFISICFFYQKSKIYNELCHCWYATHQNFLTPKTPQISDPIVVDIENATP